MKVKFLRWSVILLCSSQLSYATSSWRGLSLIEKRVIAPAVCNQMRPATQFPLPNSSLLSWHVSSEIRNSRVEIGQETRNRTYINPKIDWGSAIPCNDLDEIHSEDLWRKFSTDCVPRISLESNHHVSFRSDGVLSELLRMRKDHTDHLYRKSIGDVTKKNIDCFEPNGIRYVDAILRSDKVLFSVYPSSEIANQGIKKCRWFVNYKQIEKLKSLDAYSESLAILKRWASNYDSIALMYVPRGARLCYLEGRASFQTHPKLRSQEMYGIPYETQLERCSEMRDHLYTNVKDSFTRLSNPDHLALFQQDRIVNDLQIQLVKGGGNQLLVLHAENAQIFNLGIVTGSSDRLDIKETLERIANGVDLNKKR